jgi:hypothetical protein
MKKPFACAKSFDSNFECYGFIALKRCRPPEITSITDYDALSSPTQAAFASSSKDLKKGSLNL